MKTDEDFCLSDEERNPDFQRNIYFQKDVIEFVRRLKEDLKHRIKMGDGWTSIEIGIDILAGEKLI
jgi:hypothetical protein